MNIIGLEISGYYSPLIFLAAAIITAIITYLIWRTGSEDVTGDKTGEPFLSGNPEFSKTESHVSGDNLYWGLKQALGGYYRWMKKIHTGIINDYTIWYLATVALLLLLFIGVL